MPEKIDWSAAPEGTTHFCPSSLLWYRPGPGTRAQCRGHLPTDSWFESNSEYAAIQANYVGLFVARPAAVTPAAPARFQELTIRDHINQIVAFATRALAFAEEFAPYYHIDMSCRYQDTAMLSAYPLMGCIITLTQRKHPQGITHPTLRTVDGVSCTTQAAIYEGGFRAERYLDRVVLNLPQQIVSTRLFVNELFRLMALDHDACIYAQGYKSALKNDLLPQCMPDLSHLRWSLISDADPRSMRRGSSTQLGSSADSLASTCDGVSIDTPLWKLREAARTSRVYDPLPAEVKEALDPAKAADLFPHLSEKTAGMIAYTENGTKGAMDRQSVMKAGRFIRQFGYSNLTDEDVKRLAAKVMATTKLAYRHSKAREDYSHVYQTGPNSCMAYGPKSSRGTFDHTYVDGEFAHPAEVYAHPDNNLELVWGEMDGEVISRTIINTKKKTYPRIYGKENVSRSKERLKDYLAELGYSQSDDALDGEKLLLLNPDDYPDAIICPYIDTGNRGVEIHYDHLVVGGYEQANHETGCLFRNDPGKPTWTWTCACCDEQYDEDEDNWTDENGDQICGSCLDSHTYAFSTQAGESRYVHEDCTVYRLLGTITDRTLRHYDYVYPGYSSLSRYGLVELSSDLYDESAAAEREQCVEYEGGDFVLHDDLDRFNLFYDEDDCVARDIDEWAVVRDADGDEELVKRWRVNTDTHVEDIDESSDIHCDLPVYVPIADEDDTIEEAA